jgi:acyl-CoA synthetase (AMP-forming)/AMP-acid ligase II
MLTLSCPTRPMARATLSFIKVRRRPLAPFLHSTLTHGVAVDERYTFTQAHARVDAIASLLYHQYGCRKGDRIAICARNLPEWIFTFWVRLQPLFSLLVTQH